MFMKNFARSRGALAAGSAALAAVLALTGLAPASAAGASDEESQAVARERSLTSAKTQPQSRATSASTDQFRIQIQSPSWSLDDGFDSEDELGEIFDWAVGDLLTVVPLTPAARSWTYDWYVVDPDDFGRDKLVKSNAQSFRVPDGAVNLAFSVDARDASGFSPDLEFREEVQPAWVKSKVAVRTSGAFAVGRSVQLAPVVNAALSPEPERKAGFCQGIKDYPGVRFTSGALSQFFTAKDFGTSRLLYPCQAPMVVTSLLPHVWEAPNAMVSRYYEENPYTTPKIARGTLPSGTVRTVYGKSVNPKSTKVGQKLVAQSTAKTVAGQRNAYQWLRDGKAIKGASKSSYTPGAADYKHKVSVRITRSAAGYGTVAKTTGQVSITIGASKAGKASVSGTAQRGKTVRAKLSGWASGSKYSYQWYRNGKAIKGATKSSYKLAGADRRKTVKVKVTAKKTAWTTVSTVTRAVRVR